VLEKQRLLEAQCQPAYSIESQAKSIDQIGVGTAPQSSLSVSMDVMATVERVTSSTDSEVRLGRKPGDIDFQEVYLARLHTFMSYSHIAT
jgi:hypothetical protein